jgi:hypothetical protein
MRARSTLLFWSATIWNLSDVVKNGRWPSAPQLVPVACPSYGAFRPIMPTLIFSSMLIVRSTIEQRVRSSFSLHGRYICYYNIYFYYLHPLSEQAVVTRLPLSYGTNHTHLHWQTLKSRPIEWRKTCCSIARPGAHSHAGSPLTLKQLCSTSCGNDVRPMGQPARRPA